MDSEWFGANGKSLLRPFSVSSMFIKLNSLNLLNSTNENLLFFLLSSTVPLSSIFEPVAYLRCGESGGLGEFAFLSWCWIWIRVVPLGEQRVMLELVEKQLVDFRVEKELKGHLPITKNNTRFFFETVGRLFAVPDCARQRKLASNSVLAHGAQCPAALLLGLHVVRSEP